MALVATLGCGDAARDAAPLTVPVSGSITMGGKAVEGAIVSFHTRSATGKSATGTTDEQGNFTLTTYLSPRESPAGALPGEYEVLVAKMGLPAAGAAGPGFGAPPGVHLLPEKYSKQGSGLKAVVTQGGGNEFKFDLEVDQPTAPQSDPE
ncbi:MAG: carboxypeptidase-like regulatory domain-containing protein [Pirellulales bacterium]